MFLRGFFEKKPESWGAFAAATFWDAKVAEHYTHKVTTNTVIQEELTRTALVLAGVRPCQLVRL